MDLVTTSQKNVEYNIGLTPKEYMRQLAKRDEFNFTVFLKYVPYRG